MEKLPKSGVQVWSFRIQTIILFLMRISKRGKTLRIGTSDLVLRRDTGGVVHIKAKDALGAQRGLGFVHAHDRLIQMHLTRILSYGKITERLFDSDEAFAFDLLIRKLGLERDLASDVGNLSDQAKEWCLAYCEGVNTYVERYGLPFMGRLLGFKFEPWKIEDTMLLIKMHMYLGLAQLQERVERFIIQAIHDGIEVEKVKKLFAPQLDGLGEETIELIKNLQLDRPYLDVQMKFQPGLSNNWIISGEKTVSGEPLCANDPHLQVNRLPGIWYEVVMQAEEKFQMGISTPGFPGIVMGRSNSLSASFTYGMMDTVDFFIEEVRGKRYRRESGWENILLREEVVHRKKKGKTVLKFYETDTGVIERKNLDSDSIENGLYLSLAWSGMRRSASPMLNALVKLWSLDCAHKAGECIREVTLSCNWALADRKGSIAYQQSGRLPNRAHSGLFPLPAWEEKNRWKGFVDPSQLSCEYNPDCGFIATANDNKNQEGKPLSISVPFASYRYEQICRTLSQDKKFTLEDMKALQSDLYSIQAEKYLNQIRSLIPNTSTGSVLNCWDCRYTKDSKGATLFEAFYLALLQEVFGKVFGEKAWNRLATRHSLLVFTHGHFDRILLSDDESWFGEEGKMACIEKVLAKTLSRFTFEEIPTWGKKNQFMMYNLLFDGKLPKCFGFDLGPLVLEGNRATIAASQTFHERKRGIAAAASYRFITDLSIPEAFTIMAGGVSEKRLSKYYKIDVQKWLNFEYKKLTLYGE